MLEALLLFLVLFIVWFVFSGFTQIFFLILGTISCVIAVFFARKMGIVSATGMPPYLRIRSIFYAFWLTKEIFKSSFTVAQKVWDVEPDIKPALGWVPAHVKTETGKATYANSITLTPGTVCVEVVEDRMLIHALCADGLEDLRKGEMAARVAAVIE